MCRWHMFNADRAEGETATWPRGQSERDKEAARPRVANRRVLLETEGNRALRTGGARLL